MENFSTFSTPSSPYLRSRRFEGEFSTRRKNERSRYANQPSHPTASPPASIGALPEMDDPHR